MRRARELAARAADLIWPPKSLLSERQMERPGVIEPELWRGLSFLTRPWCARCGFPFERAEAPGSVCGVCAIEPPDFDRARAALVYDDASRKLVLDLKHSGRRDGLPVFAQWMKAAGAELIETAELIVPVPLHWSKLAQRTFNQSAWLAAALAQATGKPWRPDLLARTKRRRSQADLTARQREANVRGAFRAGEAAAGLAILLVDDVLTTGATLNACARALAKAGATRTDAVTLARVVRATPPPI